MAKVLDLSKWAKLVGSDLEDAMVAFKIELFSSIVLDTRVDTGRLRGNWQTSTGTPITSDTNREDKNGSKVTQEIERTVTPDDVDYMTNNLPYAEVWEEKDAMVAKNFARIDRIIADASKATR